MTTYTAEVTRDDEWLMIFILELDLLTQASNWSEVDARARGIVAEHLSLQPTQVRVEVQPRFKRR